MRDQTRAGPGVVEWSLPAGEVGEVTASVPLPARLDPDETPRTWCPVCDDTEAMQAVVTTGGRRFDRCAGCGSLLEVDRRLGRVLVHRLVVPPRPGGRRRRQSRRRSRRSASRAA